MYDCDVSPTFCAFFSIPFYSILLYSIHEVALVFITSHLAHQMVLGSMFVTGVFQTQHFLPDDSIVTANNLSRVQVHVRFST